MTIEKKVIKIPDNLKEGQVLIVKVGSEERPASVADIESVQLLLAQAANDTDLTIVTHHAIDFQIIDSKLLEKCIITGYFVEDKTPVK